MQKESLSTSMPKLILAVVLIVCVGAVIIGGYLIFKEKKIIPCHSGYDSDCPLQMRCEGQVCVNVGCADEGEVVPAIGSSHISEHTTTECCRGLKGILHKDLTDNDCNLKMWGGGTAVCTKKCGNGICDTTHESKCNCPEDCK